MVQQVFVTEIVEQNGTISGGYGLAFGSHPEFPDDDGVVTSAPAVGRAKPIRIVLNKRIPGNPLNEIACANGLYAPIPAGLSEEDLAFCSASQFSPSECLGNVCAPYGFLDNDEDGIPDGRRLIDYDTDPDASEYALNIHCDGVRIPLDANKSGYAQDDSQLDKPFSFPDNLVPVIFLQPSGITGLRTNATCTLTSRPELVGADGIRVCAPAGGDLQAECSDGDLSPISFRTEPVTIRSSVPADGATDVPLDASSFILLTFNAHIDETSRSAVTLKANGALVDIAPQVLLDDTSAIRIIMNTPFEANSLYELEVSTALADKLGGTMPTAGKISWTTGI